MFNFLYDIFGPILHWFYQLTGSYGWAIILFAIFAKVITIPFGISQAKSSKIMKMMAPYQARINKKYGANTEKGQSETMRLYKNFGYSPFAGCLPLLIQFPLIIGLFGVMRDPQKYVFTADEFAQISMKFMWIADLKQSPSNIYAAVGLSSADFWVSLIIPVISTVLMIVSQRLLTPQMADQQQSQKMMAYSMNIVMLFVFYSASQGLAIYWTLNSILSIIQSLVLDKVIKVPIPEIIKQKQEERANRPNPTKQSQSKKK